MKSQLSLSTSDGNRSLSCVLVFLLCSRARLPPQQSRDCRSRTLISFSTSVFEGLFRRRLQWTAPEIEFVHRKMQYTGSQNS